MKKIQKQLYLQVQILLFWILFKVSPVALVFRKNCSFFLQCLTQFCRTIKFFRCYQFSRRYFPLQQIYFTDNNDNLTVLTLILCYHSYMNSVLHVKHFNDILKLMTESLWHTKNFMPISEKLLHTLYNLHKSISENQWMQKVLGFSNCKSPNELVS